MNIGQSDAGFRPAFLCLAHIVENRAEKSFEMTKNIFKKALYKTAAMWYNLITEGNAATADGKRVYFYFTDNGGVSNT